MISDPDERRRELAQIHIAKKQLGIDEDTYRAMLKAIARVDSAADLGDQGRKELLHHLRTRGFRPRAARKQRPTNPAWDWVNKAAPDRQALLRKIAVMLRGADRTKAYADGIAQHMHGVQRVEWCSPVQLRAVVSALVRDQNRRAG